MATSREHFVLKLETFEGKDTFVHCGDHQQNFLFCIVVTNPDGTATIVDSGYRSEEEARAAWSNDAHEK